MQVVRFGKTKGSRPLPNMWHHVKWVIHHGTLGSLDFYWNDMATPTSTGNLGYANAALDGFEYFNILHYYSGNYYYIDEISIADPPVPAFVEEYLLYE